MSETIEIILAITSIFGAGGVGSMILHEILLKRKQRARREKKLDTLMECFEMYVEDNGTSPKIKKIIKKKIKECK